MLRAKHTAAPVGVTLPTTTPTVRASIDPDYTQDPSNPLDVTWTYSASATGASSAVLPAGVLAFSVTPNTGGLGPVGGCSINVDATTTGGTCTVDLPSYGAYTITVTYTGSGSTVAPATFTENETIPAPPAPPPTPPTATTTTLTIGDISTWTGSSGPPLNETYYDGSVALIVSTTAPAYADQTITLTDLTSGKTVTFTQQGVQFATGSLDPESVMISYGSTLNGQNNSIMVASTDHLEVSATTDASPGYLGSTSQPVPLPDPVAGH